MHFFGKILRGIFNFILQHYRLNQRAPYLTLSNANLYIKRAK